jgi:homoserine O-acetyltransferase
VQAPVALAGITTDRLYPLAQQEELSRLLPGHPAVTAVESAFGHDGFLLEIDQVGHVVRVALDGELSRGDPPLSPGPRIT